MELFSLEERSLRGDIIETSKILRGLTRLNVEDMFVYSICQRARANCVRLWRERSRLEVRANFFCNRVVN